MTAPVPLQRKTAEPAGPGEKSPDAFRTISEVSTEIDVPQHVLRFWETRFPQIKPMKRGGGRRLYRPDHVALLRGIRALLYDDGMTIKGVQKVLREHGVRTVSARGSLDASLSVELRSEEGTQEATAAGGRSADLSGAISKLEALLEKLSSR